MPMLDRLSIPTHIFPHVIPSATVLGDLLPAVADECGLPALPVIAPACHDTGSAVAAVADRANRPAPNRNLRLILVIEFLRCRSAGATRARRSPG